MRKILCRLGVDGAPAQLSIGLFRSVVKVSKSINKMYWMGVNQDSSSENLPNKRSILSRERLAKVGLGDHRLIESFLEIVTIGGATI